MLILAIDPGPVKSAYLIWDNLAKMIKEMGIICNHELKSKLFDVVCSYVVIEKIECFGMPVGREVFKTVEWIGRFKEAYHYIHSKEINEVGRRDIKLYFCNSVKAKDSNIRQVLIDLLGNPGTKKEPGITYGVRKDIWSALAIAIYFDNNSLPYKRIPSKSVVEA